MKNGESNGITAYHNRSQDHMLKINGIEFGFVKFSGKDTDINARLHKQDYFWSLVVNTGEQVVQHSH